jgi:hypothetical protein
MSSLDPLSQIARDRNKTERRRPDRLAFLTEISEFVTHYRVKLRRGSALAARPMEASMNVLQEVMQAMVAGVFHPRRSDQQSVDA